MRRFYEWLSESVISMDKYMEKGEAIPSNFSVHNLRKTNPQRIPIKSLRYGQTAIRAERHPDAIKKNKDHPIAVSKNSNGTYTIGDGHHRTVEAIKRGDTHIMAYVHS